MTADLEHSLYIGPAGWHYEDWDGIVYPLPRPRGFDPLGAIASYFNLIEINSSFYHVPAPHVCRSWVRRVQANPRFLFTVKAHQALSHRPDVSPPAEQEDFLRALGTIADGGRLGAVLLQFPWSFRHSAETRTLLDARMRALEAFPLAVEVRHASWEAPDAVEFLAERGVSVCGVDQPVIGESRPPFVHQPGSAGVYLRLHGRNYRNWFARDSGRDARYDYLYSDEELAPWADVARAAASAGNRTYVVLNNHFRGQGPANAFALTAMVLGRPVRVPALLRAHVPALEKWSESDGDDSAWHLFPL